jgi:DNA-binding transcriptional regulator LsrR (DeoR family)
MGRPPIDSSKLERINYLVHEAQLQQKVVAKRLGVSTTTVWRNLMTLTEWKEFKSRNSLGE